MEYNLKDKILASVSEIENNLSEKLSIKDLAESVFISNSHYQRLFHAVVGDSVMEYIKKRRLVFACRELCETKGSVLDVALKYGYECV